MLSGLSYVNCIISLILSGLLIYTFTTNWWKFEDGENVYHQSLIQCDKIKHCGTIEIAKALFYGVLTTNIILIYVALKVEAYYFYLVPFLANTAGMLLITIGIPLSKDWEYQNGFIVGWVIVGIELLVFLANLITTIIYHCKYKKKEGYQEIV